MRRRPSYEGIVAEMRALREALGPDIKLMVDLHWKFTAAEAVQLIGEPAPYRPYFVEAPSDGWQSTSMRA